MDLRTLISKYATSGPRYTSYPTAPEWKDTVGGSDFECSLNTLTLDKPLSLYIHIPFCESLCYYCGCNIHITHDHSVAENYLKALITEMRHISSQLKSKASLCQISWGGGTPTFLSCDEISTVHAMIEQCFDVDSNAEISMEIDPRVTSFSHLELLRNLGFNRLSLGVQDFDPQVQKAVNRIQSYEMTAEMMQQCRSLGFEGLNFDLIYGLPFQSIESFERTLDKVIQIRPDRIALYNYAHLPSLRPHQKILEKHPSPHADERLSLFLLSLERFKKEGYVCIGMDHFALESDELTTALEQQRLYRNFMGYTVKKGHALLGIGASSISELPTGFFQNLRETKSYEDRITTKGTATFRGCALTEDDLRRKWVIQSLMCQFAVNFPVFLDLFHHSFDTYFSIECEKLQPFIEDELLGRDTQGLKVTPLGRLFIRNIAMVFDAYLTKKTNATFSKTL